ncbi:MAG: histidine phosphatase family protein [Quisquiliibacterium sp.]
MSRFFFALCARFTVALLAGTFALGSWGAEALSLEQARDRLTEGGYLLMMRHARTVPGTGDPANFRIGDCATQRNLSQQGREQARAIGIAMRKAGIRLAQVRSSQWCRCRETAELAFGQYQDWPALNSFFGDYSTEKAQTRQVLEFAATRPASGNVMLVTHQVNISAAMGVYPSQGEIIAGRWRDGRLQAEFRFGAER